MMWPVAADDLAAALADVATQAPVNGVVELAGPPLRLDELARRVLQARGEDRTVVQGPRSARGWRRPPTAACRATA
jgi:uncharacterized protein YbjT (DUF2867 family)